MPGVRGRWSRSNPCPICGGYPTLPAGRGIRCFGFLSTDGRWAYCVRPEYAGNAPYNAGANGYGHALEGTCPCGVTHGAFSDRSRVYIPTVAPKAPKDDRPRLDPDLLHQVYSALLALLPLRRAHADFYAGRGAADLAAARDHGYGSLPLGSSSSRQIVDTLVARFGIETMKSVPGFYEGKDGRLLTHTARATEDAAIIPLRDEQGRITMLIRHYVSGDKPKYMAFAGSRAAESYAVAGAAPDRFRQVVLVEGPHKAHVAAQFSAGLIFIGLMGSCRHHRPLMAAVGADIVVPVLVGVFLGANGASWNGGHEATVPAEIKTRSIGCPPFANAYVRSSTITPLLLTGSWWALFRPLISNSRTTSPETWLVTLIFKAFDSWSTEKPSSTILLSFFISCGRGVAVLWGTVCCSGWVDEFKFLDAN